MPTHRPSSLAGAKADKPLISDKARQRPVRVLPPDDRAEQEAGHLIGGPRLSSNITRPDSDSKEGFGSAPAYRNITPEGQDAETDYGTDSGPDADSGNDSASDASAAADRDYD